MSQPFESVRERLLRAGIAPRHAARYVVELREHLADLTARERSTGLDDRAAGERARTVLGTDAQLAQAMIDKTPRSLATRAPWAVFALLPLVALIAILFAIDDAMIHLLTPVHTTWPGGVPDAYKALVTTVTLVASYLLGPAIAAGCIALALRQRLSSAWIWVGFVLIALFAGLFGFHMNILPPQGGQPGGAIFSAIPRVWVNGRPNAAQTLAMVGLRATVLFAIAALAYRAGLSRYAPGAGSPAHRTAP
jgi:hypothetical protein